jgi:hypothetical protein
VSSFSSVATSSASEASGNASISGSSSASLAPGCPAPRAVSTVCIRQMKGFGQLIVSWYNVAYVERGRTRYAMFAAGVPFENSSEGRTHNGEL